MLTPKGQQPAPPPDEFRPWYYHNMFLFLTFVLGWLMLWPVWSVLIMRSPWHNGIISGGLAWAMLLTGGFRLWEQMQSNPTSTVVMLLPGLALTVATQVLWSRHKRTLPAASPTAVEASTQDSPPDTTGEDAGGSASVGRATPPFRNTRARRRNPRRRSSGSGRRPPPS